MNTLERIWKAIFTIRDEKGRLSRMVHYFIQPIYNHEANAGTGADSGYFPQYASNDPVLYAHFIAQELERFITGAIVSVTISTEMKLPLWWHIQEGISEAQYQLRATPLPNSDVEEIARLSWRENMIPIGFMDIPTFNHEYLPPDGRETNPHLIDEEFPELQTPPAQLFMALGEVYNTSWFSGSTDILGTRSRGEKATPFTIRKAFRRSTKGRRK